VLIGYEDLAAMEETLDILGDPAARKELAEAEEAVVSGDVVEGVEAVRNLRPRS